MRTLMSLLMAFVFSSAPLLAQASGQRAGGNAEQALLDIERKWAGAGLKSDAAAIEGILSASWSSINADGKVVTRAQSLDNTKKSKLTRSEVSAMSVRAINATTAVVTGVWSGAGTDEKGQKFDTTERWTDVFANEGGVWKCVASQSTTIKK